MNRLISLLLCVLLALSLLTACGPAEAENPGVTESDGSGKKSDANYLADKKFDTDEYLEGYDAGVLCYDSWTGCETQDAYYMFGYQNNYSSLMFYDKASGISGPLCAKPECMHGTPDCSAYLYHFLCFCYYDGRIYWVGGNGSGDDYLYSCAADGSDRKEIALVREMPATHQMNFSQWILFCHRGYCYVAFNTSIVENGVNVGHNYLYAISLKTGEKYEVLDDLSGPYISGPTLDFGMYAIGNDIYILSDDGSVDDVVDITPIILRVFHSKTRELETICKIVPPTDNLILMGNLKVTPERDIYICTWHKDDEGNRIVSVEKVIPEENRSEVVFTPDCSDTSVEFTEDYIFKVPIIEDDGSVTLEAWDYDGNPISFGTPKFEAGSDVTKRQFENQNIACYPCAVKDGVFFCKTINNYFVRFALDGSFAEVLLDANHKDQG